MEVYVVLARYETVKFAFHRTIIAKQKIVRIWFRQEKDTTEFQEQRSSRIFNTEEHQEPSVTTSAMIFMRKIIPSTFSTKFN